MANSLVIKKPDKGDIDLIHKVFEISIKDAFEKDGIEFLLNDIESEITSKKTLLYNSFCEEDIYFLIAKLNDEVIGTISFSLCNEHILRCTNNDFIDVGEIGSIFVLPYYQNQGMASLLIDAMLRHLKDNGIDEFCLDSGYKAAQKKWVTKFGTPYMSIKDYWGPDSCHMIWLCKVSNIIKN